MSHSAVAQQASLSTTQLAAIIRTTSAHTRGAEPCEANKAVSQGFPSMLGRRQPPQMTATPPPPKSLPQSSMRYAHRSPGIQSEWCLRFCFPDRHPGDADASGENKDLLFGTWRCPSPVDQGARGSLPSTVWVSRNQQLYCKLDPCDFLFYRGHGVGRWVAK